MSSKEDSDLIKRKLDAAIEVATTASERLRAITMVKVFREAMEPAQKQYAETIGKARAALETAKRHQERKSAYEIFDAATARARMDYEEARLIAMHKATSEATLVGRLLFRDRMAMVLSRVYEELKAAAKRKPKGRK